jgi:hypothetical protein
MSRATESRAATTEIRRRQILDAALRCFNQSGLAETKMGDICTEAGVSTGSVYHHFAGKDQLAAALYLEGSRDYTPPPSAASAPWSRTTSIGWCATPTGPVSSASTARVNFSPLSEPSSTP